MPDLGGRSDGKRGNWQPRSLRDMTVDQAAYVGAMIEAEGSVTIASPTCKSKARVTVVNTDLEVISALVRATGAGSVHLSHARTAQKPVWVWWLSRWNDVQPLVAQCAAYSTKLQRVQAEYRLGNGVSYEPCV